MCASVEQTIREFLSETESLVDRVDELPYSTAVELYDMLDIAAKSATSSIKSINPELRVEICARQDEILERIVDLNPTGPTLGGRPAGIYAPSVRASSWRWSNTELLKDTCLAVYTLAKCIGTQAFMYFCTNPSDYPYLSTLPGLNLLYQNAPDDPPDTYFEHLKNNYNKMDVLILHGMYDQGAEFLDAYRTLRPDGKVYCTLDMSTYWMSLIDWEHPKAGSFAEQCDILTTSCISVRDALNKSPNVRFPCRWLPSGFFNSSNDVVRADPDYKKNVILTVGRIGATVKNNEELLAAFAGVSDILEGWELRLVGPIEQDFQRTINHFFEQCPSLKERVVFTGTIENKGDLYDEYARAKIFALTSNSEGGPNVYAEALFHGCMFVTSDIDAADDITGYGALGIKYSRGDVNALASALIKLSRKSDKQAFQEHIPKALDYANRYYDWTRNAKKIAHMLFNAK